MSNIVKRLGSGTNYMPVPTPQTTETGQAPQSGYVENGDYYVSIRGAEEFTDINNEPAIRIYYECTTNYEFHRSAYESLDWDVVQDGRSLVSEASFSLDDVDVYFYDRLILRSGLTLRCCLQYGYDPGGGDVYISLFGYESGRQGGTVGGIFSPGSLPGPPPLFTLEQFKEPRWTVKLPSEGVLGEDFFVSVTEAQLLADAYGRPAIRVYYEFTNNLDQPRSMSEALEAYTYQDGVSLFWTYAPTDTQTDINFSQRIAPGETITASAVFELRNGSSAVEAEIESRTSYEAVGNTFLID
jgi:hypothetical protein